MLNLDLITVQRIIKATATLRSWAKTKCEREDESCPVSIQTAKYSDSRGARVTGSYISDHEMAFLGVELALKEFDPEPKYGLAPDTLKKYLVAKFGRGLTAEEFYPNASEDELVSLSRALADFLNLLSERVD